MSFTRGRWYKTFMVDPTTDKDEGAALLTRVALHCAQSRKDRQVASRLALGSGQFFREVLPRADQQDLCLEGNLLDPSSSESLIDPALGIEQAFIQQLKDSTESEDVAAVLLKVILHAARHAHDPQFFFHYWLSENLRAWFGPRGFAVLLENPRMTALRQRIQDMITLGINLRSRSPQDFLAARYALESRQDKGQDRSTMILDALVASASFAGAGVLETIDVLSCSPKHAKAACATFGLIAGTFYGHNRLCCLRTFGRPFEEFLIPDAGSEV